MGATEIFRQARLPVLATHTIGAPRDLTLQMHVCEDSGTRVVVNAAAMPFSPFTGGNVTAAVDDTVALSAEQVQQLTVVAHCHECHSATRTDPELAAKLIAEKAELHCVLCSGTMIAGEGLDEEESAAPAASAESTAAEDEEEPADDEEVDDEEEEAPADDEEVDDEESEIGDEEVEEEAPADDEEVDDEEEEESRKSCKAGVEEASVPPITTLPYTLTAHLQSSMAADRLDLVLATSGKDPAFYLMLDRHPVALMERAKAQSDQVKELFGQPELLREALAAASTVEGGLQETALADFGISPIEIQIPVDEAVREAVRAGTIRQQAHLSAAAEAVRARFDQSISIAAVGINKGLFADVAHPVKEGFYEELTRLGVKNAERVIDRVFASHGEALMKAVVAKAVELSNESDDARNATAKMVESARYQAVASESVSDEMNSRLEEGNLAAAMTGATPVLAGKAPDNVTHISTARADGGGNRFTGLVKGLGRRHVGS